MRKSRIPITEIKAFVPHPCQLAKARELLGWSVADASGKAKITQEELLLLEADPRGGTSLMVIELVYRDAGITFALFAGLSGQIYKTRLGDGPWSHFTRRGPLGRNGETLQ